MKAIQLLAMSIIALHISTVAQASNIIRLTAPVIKSENPNAGKVWQPADSLYGEWANKGGVYGCSNWAPSLDAFPIGTPFLQNASDCQQDQGRTVQAREVEQASGVYRNVGAAVEELRTISATAQRQAVGTKVSVNDPGSFYRVLIESTNGATYAQMAEVELINSAGKDLFDLQSVTTNQSSFYSAAYTAAKLIDNTAGNDKWTSVNNQHINSWVSFKFSTEVSPVSLVIWSNSETTRQPKDFSFQVSRDNGTTWDTIKRFTGATGWVSNEKRSFSLN